MLAFVLNFSSIEFCVVLICIGAVLAAEMGNSALEYWIDFIHPEIHPQIKLVKDTLAGMVLVTSLCSFCIGLILFVPRLVAFLDFK